MAKRLWSEFTKDMNTCIETGSTLVERHHIFYGYNGNRDKSEVYGYVIPLRCDLHKFASGSVHNHPNSGLDLKYQDFKSKVWIRRSYIVHVPTVLDIPRELLLKGR